MFCFVSFCFVQFNFRWDNHNKNKISIFFSSSITRFSLVVEDIARLQSFLCIRFNIYKILISFSSFSFCFHRMKKKSKRTLHRIDSHFIPLKTQLIQNYIYSRSITMKSRKFTYSTFILVLFG